MEKHIEEFQKSQRDKILNCYISKGEEAEAKDQTEESDEFKHHRLMTGYHSLKADECKAEALQLNSATDPELHKEAKTKVSEYERHISVAQDHRENAKKLHNEEKHGEWNSTVPTKAEVLEYGNKQAAMADAKKPSDDDILKEEDEDKDFKDDEKEVNKSEDAFNILGVK